ncbi:MAG: hypothetical protein DRP62_02760 [Planctomycetota bacterium]|nr:MAG: hypothetical protein DRP62_02760 [Planctomycetota bacterium]
MTTKKSVKLSIYDYALSKETIAELEKCHRSLRDKRQADLIKPVIALFKRQLVTISSVISKRPYCFD